MTMVDTAETAQAEGEGPDGSDKPPHGDLRASRPSTTTRPPPSPASPRSNGTKQQRPKKAAPLSTGGTTNGVNGHHIPLPPPDAHSYQKAPGHTRKDLEELALRVRAAGALSVPVVRLRPFAARMLGVHLSWHHR